MKFTLFFLALTSARSIVKRDTEELFTPLISQIILLEHLNYCELPEFDYQSLQEAVEEGNVADLYLQLYNDRCSAADIQSGKHIESLEDDVEDLFFQYDMPSLSELTSLRDCTLSEEELLGMEAEELTEDAEYRDWMYAQIYRETCPL